MSEPITIGILAIQGDVEAHAAVLDQLGVQAVPTLTKADLEAVDGLVIPGGESTTISKGLDRLGLYEPIAAFAAAGRPILGTCAGAILLSRESRNHGVRTLGLLDAVAMRNAYGTQVDSFAAPADPESAPEFAGERCVFIRAPRLVDLGPGVEVLARVDGDPVLVRDGAVMACTYHPELTGDPRVHRLLVDAAGA